MTELGEMGGRPRRRRLDHAWQMGYRRIRYAAVVVCRPAKSPECDLIAGSTVRELQHRQRMGGTDGADHHREFESRGYEVERSTGRRRREDVQTRRSAMSLSVLYYTNVVRPIGSPQTTLRVSWSLLWPVKRCIDIQQLIQEAK
jgi:hypothetical protein